MIWGKSISLKLTNEKEWRELFWVFKDQPVYNWTFIGEQICEGFIKTRWKKLKTSYKNFTRIKTGISKDT